MSKCNNEHWATIEEQPANDTHLLHTILRSVRDTGELVVALGLFIPVVLVWALLLVIATLIAIPIELWRHYYA